MLPPAAPEPTPSGILLVAFDLDGTLLRGETVCEVIARHLGRLERMRELERARTIEEITAGREELVRWYLEAGLDQVLNHATQSRLAPEAWEGFSLLRQHGVTTAIVSITWGFAAEHFARLLGADHHVGSGLLPDGTIQHFWPEDKPVWVSALAERLGVPLEQVAAVGDSWGDVPMLRKVGHAFLVGSNPLDGLDNAVFMPEASILDVARAIVPQGTK